MQSASTSTDRHRQFFVAGITNCYCRLFSTHFFVFIGEKKKQQVFVFFCFLFVVCCFFCCCFLVLFCFCCICFTILCNSMYKYFKMFPFISRGKREKKFSLLKVLEVKTRFMSLLFNLKASYYGSVRINVFFCLFFVLNFFYYFVYIPTLPHYTNMIWHKVNFKGEFNQFEFFPSTTVGIS